MPDTNRSGVEQLLYLLGEAFETVMANVRSLDDDDWEWEPAGGRRTIIGILRHIAGAKHMNDDYAFGPGQYNWEEPPMSIERPLPELIDWLRDGQRRLIDHVATLDDAELLKPRRVHWGRERETRWIIANVITHDLFHAGEINHIRALHQANDRWEWETVEEDTAPS